MCTVRGGRVKRDAVEVERLGDLEWGTDGVVSEFGVMFGVRQEGKYEEGRPDHPPDHRPDDRPVLVGRWSTQNSAARVAVIVLAVLAPLAVAVARVYRGMHYPIDVVSGAVMGFACLWVGLLVARVVAQSLERRKLEALS